LIITIVFLSAECGFEQLSFSGNSIISEGETLAILAGVETNTLTSADFISI
jgi:hypothetical protein